MKNDFPDIRAEVLAVNSVAGNTQIEETVIVPRGQFKRGYHKDLLAEKKVETGKGQKSLRYFEVCRDGLYDYLPEGLFHRHHSVSSKRSLKRSLENTQKKEQEEADARTFFLAFEREFYKQRIQLELEERDSLTCFSGSHLNDVFFRFWRLATQSLQTRQNALLYLLPLCYRFAGNLGVAGKCFAAILGVEVSIERQAPLTHPVSADYSPVLGDTRLEADFALGRSVNNGIPAVEVRLGPLNQVELQKYLPSGEGLDLLSRLCDLFLPVEFDVTFEFRVSDEVAAFVLSDESHAGRLGYSTIL